MKKKIVFVIPSLSSGGAEKSLINLLCAFDYNRYDVDLVLFSKEGIFLDMLPPNVNLVALPENFAIFRQGLIRAMLHFMLRFKFGLAYNRLVFFIKNRLHKNINLGEQSSWKNIRPSFSKLPKKYDVAVGYLEKSSIYFCVDCIDAVSKIGFIRTNYEKLDIDTNQDKKYFDQLNFLCANGMESASVLAKFFPSLKEKLRVVMNVVSPPVLFQLAEAVPDFKKEKLLLLSIGRLETVKGFDMAIEAAKIIHDSGIDFQWLIVGNGSEKGNLQAKIVQYKLENIFFLIGEKANPYPYLNMCDIYIQTSHYEGRSSTINEAKIFGKPIVCTDFVSAFEQLENNKNALIVNKSPEAIAEGAIKLIGNEQLRNEFSHHLKRESLGTEGEILKFYDLLDAV